MKTVEIKVSNQPLHIVLENNAAQLGEVVVTGFANVDKRLFTGASSKISAEDARLSGVSDISRSLEGRAAGVSVQNVSGTFGTAPKIRVRGATSIYGDSKPLWVVDGVILEDAVEIGADDLSSGDANTLIASAVAGLNADDIESFQILKDGSATSIYGARAMAGVIVVTTKSGRSGHTSLNYTGELTMRLKPSYRNFNISNSQEQMGIYKEMEQKGWLSFAALANASTSGIYGQMYKKMTTYDPSTGQFGLANNQAAMNDFLREAEFRNTDWFDLLFSNSIMQNHAVSLSGGTDKGNFYASFSYMDDPGWYKSSDVQRYTFNANAAYNISPRLKVKLLTSDSYRKQLAPGTLAQDLDAVSGAVSRNFDINPYSYALNTARTTDPNATLTRNYADFNIFHELDNNYIDVAVTDVKFQGELEWKPINGLILKALGSFRHSQSQQNHQVKDRSNQAEAYRAGVYPENATVRAANKYLYTDPDQPNSLPISVLPKGGILYHQLNAMSQQDFRATAQYTKDFEGIHNVSVFGGFEASKIDRHEEKYQGWGICYDNGNIPFNNWQLFKQMNEEGMNYYGDDWTYRRSMAYFATANYAFKSRYVINGTIRYEGSNKLGKSRQSRWLPTWNVSGTWNIDSEPWFQNPVLATAKLRAGYSLTGDSGPSYVSNATAIFYPDKPWRQHTSAYELGLTLDELGNQELTYEKKNELNIGADLGFLNNRLNLEIDWYTRDNFDLIGRVYTEGVGGIIQKWANVADMATHGIEFTLSSSNIQTRDFSWTTDLTFSYSKTKITDLKSRSRVIDLVQGTGFPLQGYPHRAIFSIPFVGLNEQGHPVCINEKGEETTHDFNFQDFENLGFLKYEGPVDPPFTGGLGNQFRYKGFHLNVFMTYAFGNKVRLDPVFSSSYSDLTAMPREFASRWSAPGEERYTSIPAIASRRDVYDNNKLSYGYNAYNYSTERVAKGDFIRMKEISLTYDMPRSVLNALRLNTASVKFAATNCFLIYSDSKLHGQDPEFFNAGGVAAPIPRQFTFTLRFGL
ncbi:MAG: SusC/RagA family TonB-linked outer membrane protein [Muribaculaceae bacterium]|nr:SusC/RagA family TonB-linked outer membrane protein [Muribaculaceae bacterium]